MLFVVFLIIIGFAAWTLGLFQIPFIINFFSSLKWGEKIDKNPWDATTIENFFQLTERGQYAIDVGLFLEYSQVPGQSPNSFTFGDSRFLPTAVVVAIIAHLILTRAKGLRQRWHILLQVVRLRPDI